MTKHKFPSDYWKLCDDVTIVQAALLVLDVEPEGVQERVFDAVTFQEPVKPEGFDTILAALTSALASDKLKPTSIVKIKTRVQTEDDVGAPAWMDVETDDLDLRKTTIPVSGLKHWLIEKGIKGKFLFPDGQAHYAAYLDPAHPCYAPKLAAAVQAWLVVTQDRNLLRGKTPKQALEKWLVSNAASYGLIKDDGSLNELAVKEICKVVNWQPAGGAAKTPSHDD